MHYQNRDRLIARLKRAFPTVAALEEIAHDGGVDIYDAFQGDTIGEFIVLSPRKVTYLLLVVKSDKTPVPAVRLESGFPATWNEENLRSDTEGTSAENETSSVQFADVCGKTRFPTDDASVGSLTKAY